MKIKILFFAELKEIFGPSRFMDIHEGATVGDIVDTLTIKSDWLHSKKDFFIYAVNENFETDKKMLKNNDELALMTPLSGG